MKLLPQETLLICSDPSLTLRGISLGGPGGSVRWSSRLLFVFCVVVLLLLSSMPGLSNPFRPRPIDGNPPGGLDAVAVDFDRDGDTDVVVADGNAAWYENLGTDTSFTRRSIATTSNTIRVVRSLDFNGDGDVDVLIGSGGAVSWYENDGTDTSFIRHNIQFVDTHDLKIMDFDGDGDLDVLAAQNNQVVFYENDGSMTFLRQEIGDVGKASGLDVADINRDGHTDVAVSDRGANQFIWFENDGTDVGFTRHLIASEGMQADPEDIEVTDMNGDGRPDAVVITKNKLEGTEPAPHPIFPIPFSSSTSSKTSSRPSSHPRPVFSDGGFIGLYVKNKGDTDFSLHFKEGHNLLADLAAGDVDGDGDEDILMAQELIFANDGRYRWYENGGRSKNIRSHEIHTEQSAFRVKLTDFDGNQGPDVLGVRTGANLDSAEFKWFKNINQYPVADFTFSPFRPTVGKQVTFTDRSLDSDGSIVSWKWAFGDADTSTLQNPTHTFSTSGRYPIVLTVSDSGNESISTTRRVSVQPSGTVNQDDCGFSGDAGNRRPGATSSSSAPECFNGTAGQGRLVSQAGDTNDFYTVPVTFGDTVHLSLSPNQTLCPDYELFLYDPSGNRRGSSTRRSCKDESITAVADGTTDSGAWTVQVHYRSGADTTYQLKTDVTFEPPPGDCGSGGDAGDRASRATPKSATATCFEDVPGKGHLNPTFRDTRDFYQFPVQFDESIRLALTPDTDACPGYDFTLFDPSGRIRAQSSSQECPAKTRTALAHNRGDSGPWLLRVQTSGDTKAPYALTVRNVTSTGEPDGRADLVLLGENERSDSPILHVYRNDGDSGFVKVAEPLGTDNGLHSGAVDLADFNGDGIQDLAASGRDAKGNARLIVFKNQGFGAFTKVSEPLGKKKGLTSSSLEWGDLDSDGRPDLVVAGRASNDSGALIVYGNWRGKSFTVLDEPMGPDTGVHSGAVDLADYDSDGDSDLAVSGTDSRGIPRLIVFQNQGDGTFNSVSEPMGSDTGLTKSSLDWGDYNGDGLPDLAVTGQRGVSSDAPRQTFVLRNNGNNTFSRVASLEGGAKGSVEWADFNADNRLDLVLTGVKTRVNPSLPIPLPHMSILIYRGTASGDFRLLDRVPAPRPQMVVIGNSATTARWGKLDADTFPDLATVGPRPNGNLGLTVYHNNGDSSFSTVSQSQGPSEGLDSPAIEWGDVVGRNSETGRSPSRQSSDPENRNDGIGCVIQRSAPSSWTFALRDTRDELFLHTRIGRVLTSLYYSVTGET